MRFAIVGSNFIADRFVRAARECENLVLQTAYSRTREQALQNAERWGTKSACWDFAELSRDQNIDAVYIASPNAFHYQQIGSMLLAGKHVLCEKPIVPSEKELIPLLEQAGKRGLLLLEAMRPAHLPALETIRELLPKLGTLRYAEFPYAQYSSRYDRFKEGIVDNAFNPTLANGALMDLGVYCVHWMVMLLGEPGKVVSLASFIDDSIDVCGSALCDFGGMQVHLCYSKVHQSLRPAVIEGEAGSLTLSPFPIPTQAELRFRSGETTLIPLETREHDMAYEIFRFMKMTKNPGLAEPYHRWTQSTLRVMDAIRAENGIDFAKRKH
ncbi:MAG: Gfo/Idh/MocA family oxidoreductase [Clostridiales bacterium]|nr:Gfo/Idh/MocA family oxidoreductase [Clostridiales bacterium]